MHLASFCGSVSRFALWPPRAGHHNKPIHWLLSPQARLEFFIKDFLRQALCPLSSDGRDPCPGRGGHLLPLHSSGPSCHSPGGRVCPAQLWKCRVMMQAVMKASIVAFLGGVRVPGQPLTSMVTSLRLSSFAKRAEVRSWVGRWGMLPFDWSRLIKGLCEKNPESGENDLGSALGQRSLVFLFYSLDFSFSCWP